MSMDMQETTGAALARERIPGRRNALRLIGLGALWASALAGGWMRPLAAFAAQWNKAAFDARAVADALKGIGAGSVTPSDQIDLKAPEIAENGAIVPVEVVSRIPGTQAIHIVADKNPQPLVATFEIGPAADPFISTRIKMAESSSVRVLVKAGEKFYSTSREVKVTIGGCGG